MKRLMTGQPNPFMRHAEAAGVLAHVQYHSGIDDPTKRLKIVPEYGIGSSYLNKANRAGVVALELTLSAQEQRLKAAEDAAQTATVGLVEVELPELDIADTLEHDDLEPQLV